MKCYVIYAEVETDCGNKTYLEGAFVYKSAANEYFRLVCAEYWDNEIYGTVYLTEWAGNECEILAEEKIYDMGDEEDA